MRTYKVLALLLSYPQPDWLQALEELEAVLRRERWRNRGAVRHSAGLFDHLRRNGLVDVQSHYVAMFDNTPEHSLHLYEHLHGESRDRGQAMVSLMAEYRQCGLRLSCAELPDHLPVFLEFLSELPPRQARRRLGDFLPVLSLLHARLEQAGSPYAGVLRALVRLAPGRATAPARRTGGIPGGGTTGGLRLGHGDMSGGVS